MNKTRVFPLVSLALASLGATVIAGPLHPCDDRIVLGWRSPVYARPVIVQQVIAQPVIVQSVARPTVVTVPPGSDVTIRQGWVGGAGGAPVRISAPANAAAMVAQNYQPAWVDSDPTVMVAQEQVDATSDVIVIPNDTVLAGDVIVEPFDAHDRLVVLNEFSRPGYDDRAILYRDSTGLLHERVVYGRQSRIFYDHLGRRCRYDHDASMIVVLDSRIVRDYNGNGVCDDDRYRDLHRRAELDFHRSTLYNPPHQPHRSVATPYRPPIDRFSRDSGSQRDRTEARPSEARRPTTTRPTGSAVNGRLLDQSRLTSGDRKGTRSTTRPKR